jgi:beta-lactamase superfamily II metal-dependent hydrolase
MRSSPSTHVFSCSLLLLMLAACTAGGPTELEPAPPVITIAGVEAGARYAAPVTIQISVDRGSYEARLNGATFFSGSTVSAPGDYRLEVSARAGTATASRTVEFTLASASTLIIRMLDLGLGLAAQEGAGAGSGDAILLSDSSALGMRHAMIDAGVRGDHGALDPGWVARRLRTLGVDTLEFLQLTHAHADHFGGMEEILRQVRVRRFIYNGQVRTLSSYQTVLSLAQMRADSVIVPGAVREYRLGGGEGVTRLQIVPPLPTYIGTNTNAGGPLNEGSLGTSLTRGSFRMFFTGDGEYEANHRWRTQFADLSRDVTVLKVGHHGANNAVFDAGTTGPASWLTHTAPRVSLISSNGITHPRQRALTRLFQQPENRTYCTHVHGTIEIRVAPSGAFNLTVERNADANCLPGSDADT